MDNLKKTNVLTWTAPSHTSHNRSPAWYLVFTLISMGLIAYAVYTNSILTGITFVLMIVVILVLAIQPPQDITIKITKDGITVGRVSYPYKIIKKFWITYLPPEIKTLNLETSAYINNRVIIQIGQQNPIQIKTALAKYIPEDLDREESVSEALARRFKI